MSTNLFKLHHGLAVAGWALVWVLLIGAGCGRGTRPPEALPADQVAPALDKEFKNAQTDLRNSAEMAVAALKTNDLPAAYVALQSLSGSKDLTDKQRLLVTRSLLTINDKVREAAAKGEEKAGEVLQLQLNK